MYKNEQIKYTSVLSLLFFSSFLNFKIKILKMFLFYFQLIEYILIVYISDNY